MSWKTESTVLTTDRKLDWKKQEKNRNEPHGPAGLQNGPINNIRATGVQKERRKSGAEKSTQTTTEIQQMKKETKPQIQEAEQTPHRIKLKKSMPRHDN